MNLKKECTHFGEELKNNVMDIIKTYSTTPSDIWEHIPTLRDHPEWRVEAKFENCNGLTILSRS